jgi:hypothetical protein
MIQTVRFMDIKYTNIVCDLFLLWKLVTQKPQPEGEFALKIKDTPVRRAATTKQKRKHNTQDSNGSLQSTRTHIPLGAKVAFARSESSSHFR